MLQSIGIFVNPFAKMYNHCMKLNAKEVVKVLLSKECITQKELTKILSEKTGDKHTPDGLSRKLSRGTISYNEVALIADLLGYDIEFKKRTV